MYPALIDIQPTACICVMPGLFFTYAGYLDFDGGAESIVPSLYLSVGVMAIEQSSELSPAVTMRRLQRAWLGLFLSFLTAPIAAARAIQNVPQEHFVVAGVGLIRERDNGRH